MLNIRNSVRLDFLDGIRGLAALYVVISHINMLARELFTAHQYDSVYFRIIDNFYTYIFGYGNSAVAVFIVLSGFSLMIPVSRSDDSKLRGGIKDFIGRRFRRIVPPYYAACLFCVAVIVLVPLIGIPIKNMEWYSQIYNTLDYKSILAHIFLVQNWTIYFYSFEITMWSVSWEWQIYFIFAFLLLPIYRKFGDIITISVAFLIAIIPIILHFNQFRTTCSWYIGLFALGMFGSNICYSQKIKYYKFKQFAYWREFANVSIFLAIFYLYMQHWIGIPLEHDVFIPEVILSLAVVSFIICHALRANQGITDNSKLISILINPNIERLGVFSYSLYLIHYPVLEIVWYYIEYSHFNMGIKVLLFIGFSLPLSLIISYIFHLLIEKRFLPSQLKKASIALDHKT